MLIFVNVYLKFGISIKFFRSPEGFTEQTEYLEMKGDALVSQLRNDCR